MGLEAGQTITLCGLPGQVTGISGLYFVCNPSGPNDVYFEKIGFDKIELTKEFYENTVGYFRDDEHFPSTKTLGDLETIVNRMNALFNGSSDDLAGELAEKLIERRYPGLSFLLNALYDKKTPGVEKLRGLKHLCQTAEELSLYDKIVPKSIQLDRDTYKSWLQLHPDTKLTAPAVRLITEDSTVLSKQEENIWKKELATVEDKALFEAVARV